MKQNKYPNVRLKYHSIQWVELIGQNNTWFVTLAAAGRIEGSFPLQLKISLLCCLSLQNLETYLRYSLPNPCLHPKNHLYHMWYLWAMPALKWFDSITFGPALLTPWIKKVKKSRAGDTAASGSAEGSFSESVIIPSPSSLPVPLLGWCFSLWPR